jgi:hypothetical protein
LQCRDLEAALFNLGIEGIDVFVGPNHGLGQLEVSVEEGLSRAVHGGSHETRHRHEVIPDSAQLLLVRLSHARNSSMN